MPRQTILQIAAAELNTKENPPNSNRTKYGAWYGFDGYAWCAMFVSWVYDKAGYPLGKIDDAKGFRGCQSGYNFWKANGELTRDPQPGDIVLFDWNGDGSADHTGIFEHWIKQGSAFSCLEGNTAVGNDRDGGMVMRRQRNVASVKAFAAPRVLGGSSAASSNGSLVKGDKGSDIATIQKMLFDVGYTIVVDGYFGPKTEAVIRQFQRDNKLSADGVASPVLMAHLEQALQQKAAADSKLTSGAFLKKGAIGAAVVALQKALNKHARRQVLTEDGVFGNGTLLALKQFQQSKGLTADGIAGPQTIAALGIKII